MRVVSLLAIATLAGCDYVWRLDEVHDIGDGGLAIDANPGVGWSTPVPVTIPFAASHFLTDPSLTPDEKTIFYASVDDLGNYDIYAAHMLDPTMAGDATPVLAGAAPELSPELSPSSLSLYFLTYEGNTDLGEVRLLTRPSPSGSWSAPSTPAGLNVASVDDRPGSTDTSDTHIVFMRSDNLVELVRSDSSSVWVGTTLCTVVNSMVPFVADPLISPDGMTLVFSGSQTNAPGSSELYISTRTTTLSAWNPPELIPVSDPAEDDTDPWLSPSGKHLYFSRGPAGAPQIYFSQRL